MELTTWRVENLVPLEPLSFTDQVAKQHSDSVRASAARNASDNVISSPLWHWTPRLRPAVIHERRRRFGFIIDDEPTGDPDYS
ncbi:hypothetical protein [Streptomyces sp. NBC_01180]|uniref:hypothetical protein n=1 Tax=Streptomyces sp. NBC_01180 TaxID=2903763 RepID=UPI003863D772|nr:hypothetical protein OG708_08995 [Streptomyces sp. NBC_01180]